MRSSSKTSPSSKTGSSPEMGPEVAAEIARLMRDPDSMRAEAEQMRRSGGGGHYDPNQPRVPAGDSRGGQFASKGYRGGEAGSDASAMRATRGGAQFAELGQGDPQDANAQGMPLESLFAKAGTLEANTSRVGFLRAQHDNETNRKTQTMPFQAGQFDFVSTGPMRAAELPGGYLFVVSSTTYAYDPVANAYATIPATPARPIEIREIDRKVFIREFRR
ncbi:MAG TPA: hypothetical protein VFB68_01960 [Xanthobacteraceae bacterium]|nr:hypothetical protein [Xanthobacteraceae bacterium]